ncbi:MAG: hypothetical protein IIU65_01025, partial [Clostridia bacterium]|nr:hypothetical protein [Clostridia bacterium]
GTEYVYKKSGYTMDKLQGGYLELFFNDPEIGKHSQSPAYVNVDTSKVPDVSSYNMSEDLTYIGVMVKTGSTGAMGFDNFEIISSDAPVEEDTTVPTEPEEETTTTTTTAPVQPPVYDGETAVKELITSDNWVQGFWTHDGVISTTALEIHQKRIAYAKMLPVLPNTTYTFTAKLPKPYGLNTKQFDINKKSLQLNINFDDGKTSYTLTTGPETYYLVLSARHTNSGNITNINGLPVYQALLNNFYDDTFTLSIVGLVPVDALEVETKMLNGAALRLGNLNGLRFSTTVDAEKIAKLQAEGATVEVGTLIAPKDILGRTELTFDLDSAKYLDVKFDLSNGYYKDGNTFVGSIVNIKESNTVYSKESGNISRRFVGRGYVKVTKDGRTFISYASYTENKVVNNSRSLKDVATSLRNDTDNDNVKLYEAFKDSVDKWADAILGEISVTDEMVGGNIIVQNIEENADGSYLVTVKNDLRTTTEDWFYWAFKVEGAQGKKVKFKFSQGNRVGPYGAAVSKDLETWDWTNTRDGDGFTYTFGENDTTVYFAHNMLYHPERFYDVADELGLTVQTLCTSEGGNAVPYVKFGNGDKGIVLTSRHHACESSGSYVLEGVLKELATSDYIKENYTVMAVPFMDIDGVLAGDQGKNRAPYDHNRDYLGEFGETDKSMYASVRAVRKYVEDPANNVVQAYDSHSPWHTGGDNDSIFVYKKFAPGTERADNLETLLTAFKNNIDSSCLPYTGAHDQEYGVAGNTGTNGDVGRGFSTYMTKIPTIQCGTTFETAFFKSNGVKFSQTNAVNAGKALGRAIIEISETIIK